MAASKSRHLIKHVTLIGSGMANVAMQTADAGFRVTFIDQNASKLNLAMSAIKAHLLADSLKRFQREPQRAEQHYDETISRIHTCASIAMSGSEADLIIESIIEDMQAKRELFGLLDRISPHSTIFTTCSLMPLTEIAEILERKDKFAGLRFIDPHKLKVIQTHKTSRSTIETLREYGNFIGKRVEV